MNKSRAAILILAIAMVATLAFAQNQKSTVIGTVHDISAAGCKSCHAPHNGSVATGGSDQSTGRILLWDRGSPPLPSPPPTPPPMDTPAPEVAPPPPPAPEPRLYSFLCLSCHD